MSDLKIFAKTMEYINERWNALKAWLIESGKFTEVELSGLTGDNTYDGDGRFCIGINANFAEYLVLDETERHEKVTEEIENSLWAFDARFILKHMEFHKDSTNREDEEFVKSLTDMQGCLCESANPIVRALIVDMDEFIDDAIVADGYGHFLAWYDGKEHESGKFHIYRTN